MKKFLAILFVSLMFLTMVNAASWPFGKNKFCDSGNVTGLVCEQAWCNFNDCEYDSALELCKCGLISNNTNMSLNATEYMTRTEIMLLFNLTDEKIANISSNLSNYSTLKGEILNESNKYSDNLTIQLRNSLLDRIDNETTIWFNKLDSKGSSSSTELSTNTLILIIFGVLAIVGAIVYMGKKNQQYPQQMTVPNRGVTNFSRNKGSPMFAGIAAQQAAAEAATRQKPLPKQKPQEALEEKTETQIDEEENN